MTDAVKMALEALTDIRTSIECAAGCDEGIDPAASVSEIMSAYGTAMASAYSRAADMVNILAAIEQAGEPVSGIGHGEEADYAELKLLYDFWDDDSVQFTRRDMLTAIRHGKRLGQEFDAGEVEPVAYRFVHLDYAGRKVSRYGSHPERVNGHDPIETHPLYAHPPQSREPSDNQIDAAKAKAMDEAADFCIQTLAKALGVDDWEQADGSETWDGDVAGTIYNVLKAGRVYDDEDGRVARLEDAAQSRGQAFDGELQLKFDPRDAKRWWEENMRESKFVSARLASDGYVKFQWRDADESGDYSVPWTRIALWLAALSKARGVE